MLPGLRRPDKTSGSFPCDDLDITTIGRDSLVQDLDTAPKIWDKGGVKIARVSQGVVVKYGCDVTIWEANNMRFVSQNTTV